MENIKGKYIWDLEYDRLYVSNPIYINGKNGIVKCKGFKIMAYILEQKIKDGKVKLIDNIN